MDYLLSGRMHLQAKQPTKKQQQASNTLLSRPYEHLEAEGYGRQQD